MYKDKPNEAERQEKTREREKRLVKELWPLLVGVKQKVDRRLVTTLLGLVMTILMHRHRKHGFLLSELGRYLLELEQCQAGTKRIIPSNTNWFTVVTTSVVLFKARSDYTCPLAPLRGRYAVAVSAREVATTKLGNDSYPE